MYDQGDKGDGDDDNAYDGNDVSDDETMEDYTSEWVPRQVFWSMLIDSWRESGHNTIQVLGGVAMEAGWCATGWWGSGRRGVLGRIGAREGGSYGQKVLR